MHRLFALSALLGLVAFATPSHAQLGASYCGSAIGGCGSLRIAPPPPLYPYYRPRPIYRPLYRPPYRPHFAGRGRPYCAPLGSPAFLRSNPRPQGPGWEMVANVPGKPCGGWHRMGGGGMGVAAGVGYGAVAYSGTVDVGVSGGGLQCPALGSPEFYQLSPRPEGEGWEMIGNVPGKPCGGWHRRVIIR